MNRVCLMYHDIVTNSDKVSGFQNESAFQYKVTEDIFEEHLRAVEGRDVVFSFDDGGISFYTIAAPLLEKYGRKGLFFIATDYIGMHGFLKAEHIADLKRRGHIIGSHSCSHPENMTLLNDDDVKMEWVESTEVLSGIIGSLVKTASVPNGYLSEGIIKGAQKAGFYELYTSEPTTRVVPTGDMMILGRYVVHNNMSADDILKIVESREYRIKMQTRWKLLNVVKFLLGNNYNKVKSLLIKTK